MLHPTLGSNRRLSIAVRNSRANPAQDHAESAHPTRMADGLVDAHGVPSVSVPGALTGVEPAIPVFSNLNSGSHPADSIVPSQRTCHAQLSV
jgi:hypothetical protein